VLWNGKVVEAGGDCEVEGMVKLMRLMGMEGWCGEVGGDFEVEGMVKLMRLMGMEGW
jgi:hypothetical protein